MASAQENIGKLIDDDQERDAVHMAMAPVTADECLMPGENIGFLTNGTELVGGESNLIDNGGEGVEFIGIVDPFLQKPVEKGQRFMMWLYPNTVTSLRHAWVHPSFENLYPKPEHANPLMIEPVEPVKRLDMAYIAAREWMERFADDDCDLNYDEIMEGAEDYLKNGATLFDGPKYDGSYAGSEFWENFQVLTGREIDEDKRGSFFSCSC
jgi:hypothetical protein